MPANLTCDLTFPHSYTVAPTHHFKWQSVGWLCFAFGDYGVCGVFAFPDPDCVCVVSDGKDYWVHVNEPEKSSELAALPIRDIRSIPDARILLLADFTSLYAFGSDGQHWKQRVCWDGLNISDIQEGIEVARIAKHPTKFLLVPAIFGIRKPAIEGQLRIKRGSRTSGYWAGLVRFRD
jgi:hypothetical protein